MKALNRQKSVTHRGQGLDGASTMSYCSATQNIEQSIPNDVSAKIICKQYEGQLEQHLEQILTMATTRILLPRLTVESRHHSWY